MAKYSVCQFFTNGTNEYVRRDVTPEEAMDAFKHYTNSVAVKMGMVERVILTDSSDCINLEWEKDKGIIFPPEWKGARPK